MSLCLSAVHDRILHGAGLGEGIGSPSGWLAAEWLNCCLTLGAYWIEIWQGVVLLKLNLSLVCV
jgi:hypothetical protein